jgi:ribosomal subunit interface protein
MDLQVVIRGVAEEAEQTRLRNFAEEKVTSGLERFNARVMSATVRIEDETGPSKQGVDKRCSIAVKLKSGDVHIKEQGEEFHATIDKAVDRLRSTLSREMGKAKHGIGEG